MSVECVFGAKVGSNRSGSPSVRRVVAGAVAIAGTALGGEDMDGTTRGSAPGDAFDRLADLVSERITLADKVAAAKFGTGQPIDDPDREQLLLDRVRESSPAIELDADLSVRFFRDQIEANKLVQRGLYELWTDHPELRPGERPDLATEVRPELDRLTGCLLRTLKASVDRRERRPGHGTDRIRPGGGSRGADALHWRALELALRSVSTLE
jgi:chorismate mutase